MKKGLIFDMDGTLWDSSENVAASWTEVLQRSGCDRILSKQDIMNVMGLTMDKIAEIIFSDLPQDKRTELKKKCCKYENEYLRQNGGMLYPELENTFVALKEKYHLYIVSNCQTGYIEAFLDHFGFWKYFEDIQCYGNNLKSKGENIKLLADRNKLDKAYYIGDIQGDYDAAAEAGVGFIHAAYGFGTIRENVPELQEFWQLPGLMETIL